MRQVRKCDRPSISRVTTALIAIIVAPALKAEETVGVHIQGNGYTILSLDNVTGGQERRFHFGDSFAKQVPNIPMAGDLDNDGLDEVAMYCGREGRFYRFDDNAPGPEDLIINFGPVNNNGRPVIGRWIKDGPDRLGVYSPNFSSENPAIIHREGISNIVCSPSVPKDVYPVAFDWDFDGADEVVLYERSKSGEGAHPARWWDPSGIVLLAWAWPSSDTFPVAGDFDDDGIVTLGVYDFAALEFYLVNNLAVGGPIDVVSYANTVVQNFPATETAETRPLVGEWDTTTPVVPNSGYAWPGSTPSAQGFGSGFSIIVNEVETPPAGSPFELLDSWLIIRNGYRVHETYFDQWDPTIAHRVFSVGKSLMSSLFGIMLRRGDLPNAFPATPMMSLKEFTLQNQFEDKAFSTGPPITFFDMITMQSGLWWSESGFPSGWIASIDWVEGVTSQERLGIPGIRFRYNNGLPPVGSEIISRRTQLSAKEYAEQHLFGPLGISATRWDHEPSNNVNEASYATMAMRPRDMARFGQLYLDSGAVGATPIMTPEWVDDSTKDHAVQEEYGAWWWVGYDEGTDTDYYQALGTRGQRIFVVPSEDLILVTTADDPEGLIDFDALLGSVLATLL